MREKSRQRRSLTHVGGTVLTAGDSAEAGLLVHALDVAPATDAVGDPSRVHVHGFHTYPARLHPTTAARLARAFVPEGGGVLDPFCGSGTVLVESLILGLRPIGSDLNPLAVLLASRKSRPRDPSELDRLVQRANECAEFADRRRAAKAGATRRFLAEDTALFEPHVLLELDSLRAKVQTLRNDSLGPDLALVLSSLLVKFSRRRGDTSNAVAGRRTAAGSAARTFVQKTEEWARRLADLGKLLPVPPPPPALVVQDDATALRALPPERIDAIITSPPYAATYDYVVHHDLRLRWLGLDSSPLVRGEIGGRTAYQQLSPHEAHRTWSRELGRFFRAAARVLPRGGALVLVMADSAVGEAALRADEIVAETARTCGLIPVACASQSRPHFHGSTAAFRNRPRAEHAILLRRA